MTREKIIPKLQEFRDVAERIYGNEYKQTVKEFTGIIETAMEFGDCDPIDALITVSKLDSFRNDEHKQLLFTAATYDLIDG